MNFQDTSLIKGYHAHVYFEAETVEFAESLCSEAGNLFSVKVGRIHRKPVGPHPLWSCQIAFDHSEYANLIPWLALNRKDLSILIHTLTGNDLKDHTNYAVWLGKVLSLKLDVFR